MRCRAANFDCGTPYILRLTFLKESIHVWCYDTGHLSFSFLLFVFFKTKEGVWELAPEKLRIRVHMKQLLEDINKKSYA